MGMLDSFFDWDSGSASEQGNLSGGSEPEGDCSDTSVSGEDGGGEE